ncbi:hypothetical protein FGG08_004292 [Glutinoglossum americanum]|uniref:DUF7918 domain-containing protein n=1 Tax=Glutinoglossum americanum TaxID=1670608 RepID=A0A9P8L430_9PEZI|nr:hypothetical protein FGG08_004292 [Glutinoglossum americanum]
MSTSVSATPIKLQRLHDIEMPKLKQLLCSIEHADSSNPFREYRTYYGDGFVQTHIAVPTAPTPFMLHLSSTGYIAPGLAMFVFMDGVYQCNRNADGLVPLSESTEKGQTEVDFLVRQKEQMLNDDTWVGRDWRFEKFNIVSGEICNNYHPPSPDISHLGYIEVVVLRCLNSAGSATILPLNPGSPTPNKEGIPRIPGTPPSSPTLGGLFFDGGGDCRLPKHVSFGYDGIEDQSTKSGSKTVRFGDDESWDQFHDGNNVQWDYSYTGPSLGTWYTMDGSHDRSHRRGRFHPEEAWEQRTQAYEHYLKDWLNVNGQFDETRGHGTLPDSVHRSRSRRQARFGHNRARPPTTHEWRPRARPEDRSRSRLVGPPVVGSGSGTYRASESGQERQGYDSGYHYPNNAVEPSEQYNDGHGMQDRLDRLGYDVNWGYWDGGESGDHGIGWTGNSHQYFRGRSQPSRAPYPIQEQPTNPGTWKAPSEWNGGNGMGDQRDAPQNSLRDDNDTGQHRDSGGNRWSANGGPDVNNWVIHDGSGTWKPPAWNDHSFRKASGDDRNTPNPSAENTNFGITPTGQGTWTSPDARGQLRVMSGNLNSDTNRSTRGGGNTVHPSRENDWNGGGWKDDDQFNKKSNWGGSNNNRGNDNFHKQGGQPNEHGNTEGNWGGGGMGDGHRNQESSWKEGGNNSGNSRLSKWGGGKPNERGAIEGSWGRGGLGGGHRQQQNNRKEGGDSTGNSNLSQREGNKSNERENNGGNWSGVGNDNRPNNDRLKRGWEGKSTIRSNAGQRNSNSGEIRNKNRSNGEGSGRDGGNANFNLPNADQGYPNTRGGDGSNHGASRRGGGYDSLPNHGRRGQDVNSRKGNRSSNEGGSKGRGGNDGKSNQGSRAWGRGEGGGGVNSSGNPVGPNNGTNSWRAGGNNTRPNQADNTASREVSNQNGEDGGWGGGDTGPGHGEFNADGVNGSWGDGNYNNTREEWSGGEGNGNNGEDTAGNPNNDHPSSGNNRGEWGAGDDNNGNPEVSGCGSNRNANPGDWGGDNDNENKNNEDWNGENSQDPNLNAANYSWGDTGNENMKGDNAGVDAFSYQPNNNSGNDNYKADENNTWSQPTLNPTDNWQTDPATEESAPHNNSSPELSLPYVKPYWSSWEADSGHVQSPPEPNVGRKRSDSTRIGDDEAPLYSIHEDQLRNRSASHQVHHGSPAYYARELRKPVYLDTMEEPYAVFVFKYRSRSALERLLRIPIAGDEEDEKARLMRLSKDEIIEELLRMKLGVPAGPNESIGEEKGVDAKNKCGGGSVGGGAGGGGCTSKEI